MGNHSKRYNGHKNWQFWNVSLWINNDEGLYRMAQAHLKAHDSKTRAAASLLDNLALGGIVETPDGAKYTALAIRAAMEGM